MKLKYDELLSSFAFSVNLRHYKQARDKATLLRPAATAEQVAAGNAPLHNLEVLLPDNREMYTMGEVTEWRLAHLRQMQSLQEAFEAGPHRLLFPQLALYQYQ